MRESRKFPGSEPSKSTPCGESLLRYYMLSRYVMALAVFCLISTGSTSLGAAESGGPAPRASSRALPRPRRPRLGVCVHLRRAPGSRSRPVLGRDGLGVGKRDGAEIVSFTDDRPGRVHHLQRQPEQSARQEDGDDLEFRSDAEWFVMAHINGVKYLDGRYKDLTLTPGFYRTFTVNDWNRPKGFRIERDSDEEWNENGGEHPAPRR